MKLGDLFGADAALDPQTGVLDATGISVDSRITLPGEVFFALAGTRTDGARFVEQAIARGAIAIVSEQPLSVAVPCISVGNARSALARASARFYSQQPETIVAVTGTSGKTSVATFVRQIWARLGSPAASVGTVGLVTPTRSVYGSLTTPDPIALHRTLDEVAREGVTHLALEASSHGLDQHRLDGIRIAAGGFTNLSRDHMDYHPDVAHYLNAKLRLFRDLVRDDGAAVISADHECSDEVIAAAHTRGLRVVTVGRKGDGKRAGIQLLGVDVRGLSQILTVEHQAKSYIIHLPLVGDFQIENALVAAGLVIATGANADQVFEALSHLVGAPGRLERVGDYNGSPVFVDYAHKPDALAKSLEALRPYASRELVVVFGAGGDRDAGKRALMGAIAHDLADRVIVTDDNPRSEVPASIRAQILSAAPGAHEIGDRAQAIHHAVSGLQPGDALLVAGKGHETGQIVGNQTLPFSDHEAVEAALASRRAGNARLWSTPALIEAMSASPSGELPTGIDGISIDSRTIGKGDAYFAIKGDIHDGHAFVMNAIRAGAGLAVVEAAQREAFPADAPLLVVDDVLKALERLGCAARARLSAKVIAVTGSVGKTSTKEALRRVCEQQGTTHASVASFNNHWGVPLTLARCPASVHFAIFEIGMNHPGEITPLVKMVRPHVAVITTVEPVHLEFFAGIEAIADAKAEIFDGLEPGGVAVLNHDNSQFARLAAHAKAKGVSRVVTFGSEPGVDARLIDVALHATCSAVHADILGADLVYKLGLPGRHMVMNSLGVLLAATVSGCDLVQAALTLAQVSPPAGRGARTILEVTSHGEAVLIDESYNANPASMAAALSVLGQAQVAGQGRRIAVLGDMLELGPEGSEMHRGLVQSVTANRIDLVYCCGQLMRNLWEALPSNARGGFAESSEALAPMVVSAIRPDDVIMVKGSLGSKMKTIVVALEKRYPGNALNDDATV